MATYTTNYNLEKPEATDPFGDFRQSYNDNLDIIDANLGGGGGGGGHTIVDENGSTMPTETALQFTGNVSVTDDNVNGRTVVTILGGGGSVNYSTSEQVIGTYLGKPLYQITYSGLSLVCTNANQSYATNTDWGNIKKVVHSDIIDQYGQSCAGSVVYTGTPAKLAVYMQMANRTVTDITIQYTKTTD